MIHYNCFLKLKWIKLVRSTISLIILLLLLLPIIILLLLLLLLLLFTFILVINLLLLVIVLLMLIWFLMISFLLDDLFLVMNLLVFDSFFQCLVLSMEMSMLSLEFSNGGLSLGQLVIQRIDSGMKCFDFISIVLPIATFIFLTLVTSESHIFLPCQLGEESCLSLDSFLLISWSAISWFQLHSIRLFVTTSPILIESHCWVQTSARWI